MNSNQRAQQLEDRLVEFAIRIVKVADSLPKKASGKHFGLQLVRSDSAPALLYAEARGAESDKDFKHKCSILLKELRETHVNLRIILGIGYVSEYKLSKLVEENNELISIFVASVRTTKLKIEKAARGKGRSHNH